MFDRAELKEPLERERDRESERERDGIRSLPILDVISHFLNFVATCYHISRLVFSVANSLKTFLS